MSLHPGLEGWGWAVFKPPPGGPLASAGLGGQSPHPRSVCLCRGLYVYPWNTPPALCVWQA